MSGTSYSLLAFVVIAIYSVARPLAAAEERISGFSSGDTLTIRSTEAWMDEQPDIVHFGGGFELRASDWSLSSEQATLYGKLDDPETIVMTGSPALILVNTVTRGKPSVINGEAMQIVYQRSSNSISMEGDASLSRDDHTMNGGEIEYDIEKDHLRAGGPGGIHIRIDPDD